jgi:hypothetical protein
MAASGGGFTDSRVVRVTPSYDAVMVEDTSDETVDVSILNVALVEPDGTVTVAGTCTAPGLLLVRLTAAPPAGADAVSVTVPVGCDWPVTDD